MIDNTKGLTSNLVQQFAWLNEDVIIANTFNGVALVNIHSLEVKDLFANDPQHKSIATSISQVLSDGMGKVYFVQGQNKLYSYDLGSKHLQSFSWQDKLVKNQTILDVYADRQNALWIGTKDGLYRLNQQALRIELYASFENTPDSEFDQSLVQIYQDSLGQTWVATNQLFLLDTKRQVLQSMPLSSISNSPLEVGPLSQMTQGNNAELFLVSQYLGLITLPTLNQSIRVLSSDELLSSSKIQLTHKLNSQRLLLTDKENIYIVDGHNVTSVNTRDLGKIVEISTFALDQVLVVTRMGEFYLFDTLSTTFTQVSEWFEDLPKGRELQITDVLRLEGDSFLVALSGGNRAGLYKGVLNGEFALLFPGFIEHMLINRQGNLVFSTRSGIFQQKDKTIWPQWDTLESEPIRLSEQGNWLLWNDRKERKNYIHHCLKEDSKGRIWACTDSDGLAYYEQTQGEMAYLELAQINYTQKIKDIVEDSQGYFWITTDQGLIRYDESIEHGMLVDESNGVLDSHFVANSSLRLGNDQVVIAGEHYSYMLDTARLNNSLDGQQQQQHQVLLNQLYVHRGVKNRKQSLLHQAELALADPDEYLEIKHNEYLLSFELTTNNMLQRNSIHFEYRLTGLNDEWLPALASQNVVSYITLPPARYQFEARAVDNNSVREQNITKLKVEVMPPFWRSWPALTFYVLALLLLAYLAFMLRTRQLKQVNAELENAVKERTNQLHKSNQQVSDLLSKKQAFFASVSHEFRTPLSLILGPLNLLLDKIDEPKLKQQVSLINRNAKRLNHMVDQVLDLARLDESNQIHYKTYAVDQAIEVIAQPFVAMANMKNQQLIIKINAQGYLKLIDDSLEKIVTNLLSNAIKFTPENGIIKLIASSDEFQLTLSVEDNGIGIDAIDQDTIFERFARVDGSEYLPGSGIGLALVKELVQANNGQIIVESEKGQGTKFKVIFTLQEQVNQQEVVAVKPSVQLLHNDVTEELAQAVYPLPFDSDNLDTILIVEDNADMRSFMADNLSAYYHCITASNGRIGLALASEHLPDLVISDVMMPEMDGFELSAKLRDQETTSHIPLILLTAKGDDDSRVKAWNLDIDDYIAKPFVLNELKARIARLLAVRKILKKKFSRKIEMAIEQQSTNISELPYTSSSEQSFFERFTQIIEQNHDRDSFSRADAAALLCIGERQLNRKLSSVIDYNFAEYLRKFRLSKAKSLLSSGKQITEVSYEVGFTSPSYFSSCFKAEYGISPKAFVSQLSS